MRDTREDGEEGFVGEVKELDLDFESDMIPESLQRVSKES